MEESSSVSDWTFLVFGRCRSWRTLFCAAAHSFGGQRLSADCDCDPWSSKWGQSPFLSSVGRCILCSRLLKEEVGGKGRVLQLKLNSAAKNMVLIDSMKLLCGAEETVDSELCLGSGTAIAYVAPQRYIHALSSGEEGGSSCLSALPHHPRRKMSAINGGGGMDEEDRWEGVLDFCLAIDQAVEVDHETHMFENKRVLEFGFCTGLPSAFAFRHGAKSLCMYCWDETKLDTIVKPTLRRNNVSRSVCKFDGGDYENFKRTTSQKFDVILAPELISSDEGEFESLHDLLEGALSQDGIILFSARPHYTASDCTGNLPTFLDLLKTKGKFDAHIRWTSPKSDIAPRKLVQMTRSIR